MTDLTDFDVTLKMARSTGPDAGDVEHRTFTARGPAVDAKHAEAIAYSLGHGINDASDYQWKFCGDADTITVQPAAEQTAPHVSADIDEVELNSTNPRYAVTEYVPASDADKLRAQVADLANKLHKAQQENASHTKAGTAWANENQRLRDRLFADKPVIDAALAWAETVEDDTPGDFLKATDALHDAVESYRVMDLALDTAHANENAVQQRPAEPDEGGSPLDPTCPDCETPQYGAHICPGHPAGVA